MQTSFIQSRDGTRIRIGKSGDGARHVLLVHGLAEHPRRIAFYHGVRGHVSFNSAHAANHGVTTNVDKLMNANQAADAGM